MKLAILLGIMLLIAGCSVSSNITGISELALNEQDLNSLGMIGGTDCLTDNEYTNIVDSSIGQYSFCNYTLLDNTEVIIQLQKFANHEALDGAYQYDSSHLYSVQGLISENDYGDQSRFRLSNVNDYGGEFNDPSMYYYHLWICKDNYLIHITSKGTTDVREDIAKIGRTILSKFE